ncbi:MAG: response regulator [Cyanobacteriota bacterium]
MQQLVFIVEKVETICSNFLDLLSLKDFQVILVENSAFGLRLVKEIQPDFIFCDFNTSNINGYEILQKLREDWATGRIPFIALTSEPDSESCRQAMQLGANDYLTKPISLNQLMKSINHQFDTLRL